MTSKLTQLHVYVIGGVLILIVGVGLFFTLIKPLEAKAATLETEVGNVQNQISQTKTAEQQLAQAVQQLAADKKDLAVRTARIGLPKSQEIDLGDGSPSYILEKTLDRWLKLPKIIVNRAESFAQKSARKHGVEITTEFSAPAPPTNPASIPRDVIAWPIGKVSLKGEFNRVMAWVREWNKAPDLTSVEGLALTLADRGGKVSGAVSINVFVFPTGKAVANPAQAAPAAGGGMGGYPGMDGSAGMGGGYPGGAADTGAPEAADTEDSGAGGNGP